MTYHAKLNWITNDLTRSEMSLVVFLILSRRLSTSQKPLYNLAQFERTDIFREAYCWWGTDIVGQNKLRWLICCRQGYMATVKSCLESTLLPFQEKMNQIKEASKYMDKRNTALQDSQLHAPVCSEARTSFLHWCIQPSKYFMRTLLLLWNIVVTCSTHQTQFDLLKSHILVSLISIMPSFYFSNGWTKLKEEEGKNHIGFNLSHCKCNIYVTVYNLLKY